jgi:hypothetical protein
MNNKSNSLLELFFGIPNSNGQYYTEEMAKQELGALAILIMEAKGLITMDEIHKYKQQFIDIRNKQLIEEVQKMK